MIHFDPVLTRRLALNLREISLEGAEDVCSTPTALEQRAITKFLSHVLTPIDPNAPFDPRTLSVNERTYIMAKYMAATLPDGPNFSLGSARLSDYLLEGTDIVPTLALGFELGGEPLSLLPLYGYQAEIIEGLIAGGSLPPREASWTVMGMACRLVSASTPALVFKDDRSYEAALIQRYNELIRLPERTFLDLLAAYREADRKSAHFLYVRPVAYDNVASLVAYPVAEGQGGAALPVARFPALSALAEGTRALFGVAA